MAEDFQLQIYSLDEVDSTQRYLVEALKSKRLAAPVAVTAVRQSAGQGSRGNSWHGLDGNLFVSFAIERSILPDDLRLESSSLYFSYLLKETLEESGSALWLKWPNDFYLEDKKIGGAITNMIGETLICGIGMNLKAAPEGFGILDIDIEQKVLLKSYFAKVEKMVSWKQIFSKYALEFANNRVAFTHHDERKIALKDVRLLNDGSIEFAGQRIFSLR